MASGSKADAGALALPSVGLGVAGRLTRNASATEEATLRWLAGGGRLLDTAEMYGNLAGVGQALRRSAVPRGDVWIIGKVAPESMSSAGVEVAVDGMLRNLGTHYFDVLLLHWPGREWTRRASDPACVVSRGGDRGGDWSICRREAWEALRKQLHVGHARYIGVSNFNLKHLTELERVGVGELRVLQMEFHPWYHDQRLLAFCKQHGIAPVAFGVFSALNAGVARLDPLVVALAAKYGRSVPQILWRWAIDSGLTVLVGASRPRHMAEALRLSDVQLERQEVAAMSSIPRLQHQRAYKPDPCLIFSPVWLPEEPGSEPLCGGGAAWQQSLFGAWERTEVVADKSGDASCFEAPSRPALECCGESGLEPPACGQVVANFSRCCVGGMPSFPETVNSTDLCRLNDADNDDADIVIVGAGSGGSAAARAAAHASPSSKVLLIDAADEGLEHELSAYDQVGASYSPDYGSRGRWMEYIVHPWQLGALRRHTTMVTGRGLGGSSAVNGRILMPGGREDCPLGVAPVLNDAMMQNSFARPPAGTFPRRPEPVTALATALTSVFGVRLSNSTHLLGGNRGVSFGAWRLQGSAYAEVRGALVLPRTLPKAHLPRDLPNLRVWSGAWAARLVFHSRRVAGVTIAHLPSGVKPQDAALSQRTCRIVQTSRVILAAGALRSPALLAASGLAPRATVRRLGVPAGPLRLVSSPLFEKLYLPFVWRTSASCVVGVDDGEANELFAFLGENGSEGDDFELWVRPRCRSSGQLDLRGHLVLLDPIARGRVVVASADPFVPPVVHFDPLASGDFMRLAEMLRKLHDEVASQPEMHHWLQGMKPPETVVTDPGALMRYAASSLGLWQHPGGTLSEALDDEMRVQGIQGLFVADASALRRPVRGHPDAIIRMLGRRVGQFVARSLGA